MIADLGPYAEYKESGVPWLGDVPAHWEVRRLRASVVGCFNGVWGEVPSGASDMWCVRVADFERQRLRVSDRKLTMRGIPVSARNRRILVSGDLLIEKSGGGDRQPVGTVVLYDHDRPAVCSNFVARMPVAKGYVPSFLVYLHATIYGKRITLLSTKQTTGIQNLDSSRYLSEPAAFPPPDEQAAIVRFLDWATRRVDRAIRAKRRLVALLTEQKQAIIHRAVTQGLDPSVPMKASGIPWLGEIPAHWEVRRLRHLISGRLTYGANAAAQFTNPEWPRYIRITDFTITGLLKTSTFRSLPPHIAKDYIVNSGDILFARSGATVGKAFLVEDLRGEACHAGYLIRARTDAAKILPRYLFTYAQSLAFQSWKDISFSSATIQNIAADKYMSLPIPLPSLAEQKLVLVAVEALCAPVSATIERTQRQIGLLREYRARLVADVVTGKLDVRAFAETLPDEAPDDIEAIEADVDEDADDDETGDGADEG